MDDLVISWLVFRSVNVNTSDCPTTQPTITSQHNTCASTCLFNRPITQLKRAGYPTRNATHKRTSLACIPRSIVGGFCIVIAPAPHTVSAPTKAVHNCLQQPLPKIPASGVQSMTVQMNTPLPNQVRNIYIIICTQP